MAKKIAPPCLLVIVALIGGGLGSVTITASSQQETILILVDDFVPQPLQGEQFWYYNRLGGDRGQVDGWWDSECGCARPGGGATEWGDGVVTATITQTQGTEAWVGVWTTLNHPIPEAMALNFSAIFPSRILPKYRGRVTGLKIGIQDGRGTLQVELQDPTGVIVWKGSADLAGGPQTVQFEVPNLEKIQKLNWLVKGSFEDFVVVDQVELIAELPQLNVNERAFLWSYAMLLSNWNSASGLTRDRANFPAGDFDNVSASGMQAAAAVMAWHLGFITNTRIVADTTTALLKLPRSCHGLWPHFVKYGQIAPDTEWSSLDTVIAAVALIEAREALGLDTSEVEQVLTGIDWEALILPDGTISHGYNVDCTQRLEDGWWDFGTESWLANFGYATATGVVAKMESKGPTFNGSGFIDELAWLLVPAPSRDRWDIEWWTYREQAVEHQLVYYQDHRCYGQAGLFGLSAGEVPDPSVVSQTEIYQPFGVGGDIQHNDGTSLLGYAVVVPHYAAMTASLRPDEASRFWTWIETNGLFTPLNNVESFLVPDEPACGQVVWNALKGSWNLSLQTLGWARLLTGEDNPLYAALWANEILSQGYITLCPACTPPPTVTVTSTWTKKPTKTPTMTGTKTPKPSRTSTATITATNTKKPSKTLTATNTKRPTKTRTATPRVTKTKRTTKTPTPTVTTTKRPSKTPTKTPRPSRTVTPTVTHTGTSSQTPTVSPTSAPTRTPTDSPTPMPTPWAYEREMEFPDDSTVGQLIYRSNASGAKVHGQFGTTSEPPWPPQSGYVKYVGISMPETDHLYLKVRYSKYSISSVPIDVYIDDEPTPRASFYPIDQADWDKFVWTDPIDLGSVNSGLHSIKLYTDGQQYGVADLDKFTLTE